MQQFRKNKTLLALIFSGFIVISSVLPLYSFSGASADNLADKSDSTKVKVETTKVITPKADEKKNEYKKPETTTKKIVYNVIFYLINTFIKENPQILPR